jgi:hypothetical protein
MLHGDSGQAYGSQVQSKPWGMVEVPWYMELMGLFVCLLSHGRRTCIVITCSIISPCMGVVGRFPDASIGTGTD